MKFARREQDVCLLWAAQDPIFIANKPQVGEEPLVNVISLILTVITSASFRLSVGRCYILLAA